MYTGLLHLHNLLRYVVVILLILAIVKSFAGWFGKQAYTNGDNKISLFLLISSHIQLLIGLVLYFVSPIVASALEDFGGAMKEPVLRFWGVEHILSMIIGIAIITLGRIMAKRGSSDASKFRRQAVYFTLAFVLIFSAIPWPWSAIARPWF
jgi:hypothetical protein